MARPYSDQSVYRPEGSSYTFTWVFSALLVVGFALTLAIYPPVFGPVKVSHESVKWLLFFGRFHPLVVHLPIGVLIFSLLIEMACLRRVVEERWGDMALFAIFMSAVGAVISVIFGIFLTREGGYSGGAFLLHQGLGIATAVGVIIALFLRLSSMSSGGKGLMEAYRFFLLLTFGIMSIGAHFGGNMVHGNKYLIEYAPEPMAKAVTSFEKWLMALVEKKKVPEDPIVVVPDSNPPDSNANVPQPAKVDAPPAPNGPTPPPASGPTTPPPAPAAADGQLVFKDLILPILEAKCNKCHNADKSKGDLRMDTFEALMKGGQDDKEKSVVAGKPDDSLIVKRVNLPNDQDEHMPPDGKDQLTKEEFALIKWWIQEGATVTATVKDAKIPAELQAAAQTFLKK